MLVERKHIRRSINAKYTLWSGEMTARVMQHTGVHGFHSAVIVVERMDSPHQVLHRHWYTETARKQGKPREQMLDWIAERLTELSRGTELAVGFECQVEGLLQV